MRNTFLIVLGYEGAHALCMQAFFSADAQLVAHSSDNVVVLSDERMYVLRWQDLTKKGGYVYVAMIFLLYVPNKYKTL